MKDTIYAYNTRITNNTTAIENNAKNMLIYNGKPTLPDSYLRGVAYGNNRFVAITHSSKDKSRFFYSNNGIIWTEVKAPATSETWYSLTYGNGKFVAIGKYPNSSAYSIDGVNWTTSSYPFNEGTDTVFGNGMFVSICIPTGNKYAYSVDGINWTQSTLPSSNWRGIMFGGDKFIIYAATTNTILYSTNGRTWSEAQMPFPSSTNTYYIAYGNGMFVSTAILAKKAAYSTDGINWTVTDFPFSQGTNVIAYGNNMFIGPYNNSGQNEFVYSTDGITWNKLETNLPTNGYYDVLVFENDKFITQCQANNTTYFSFDGINWQSEYKQLTQNSEDVTAEIKDLILEDYQPDLTTYPQPYFVLTDTVTGAPYKIEITNGNLVSSPLEEV